MNVHDSCCWSWMEHGASNQAKPKPWEITYVFNIDQVQKSNLIHVGARIKSRAGYDTPGHGNGPQFVHLWCVFVILIKNNRQNVFPLSTQVSHAMCFETVLPLRTVELSSTSDQSNIVIVAQCSQNSATSDINPIQSQGTVMLLTA